jgi:hypothetical protein
VKPFKFLTTKPKIDINIPDGHEFAGVTPPLYEPHTFDCLKYVLIRNIETDEVSKYCQIYQNDPLWDYNN